MRGSHVTIGYWAGPGQIKDAPKEGWFHTGDLMRQVEKGDRIALGKIDRQLLLTMISEWESRETALFSSEGVR